MPGGLRLHFNENTAGCSEAVRTALQALIREDIACYPDAAAITAKVARWFGVDRGCVQLTNGLDEGLQMVAQYGAWHLGDRISQPEIVVVEPAFEVYESCAEAVGARLVRVPPAARFAFPIEDVIGAITPATRAMYLTDPNNPTGVGIPAEAIDRVLEAAPHALVLVDEAYADFSGRTLIGPRLDRARHLVIGRTFAKAHGLAALRIGALVGHPRTLDRLRTVQLPFSVNVAAIAALSAALDDRRHLEWYVSQSAASREAIYAFCRRRGLAFWPSEGNFVLLRVGDAAAIAETMAAARVFVRDKSDAPGCAGCIRLTAGVLDHTRRALDVLEDILASRAH
ncbi:MAG: histidinol-phosphate aminotransferase family protein [Acidobacteria bacterium]|nr:histidinol-phosphate aminotransferase family protein [Acidobacteriota bacterium]